MIFAILPLSRESFCQVISNYFAKKSTFCSFLVSFLHFVHFYQVFVPKSEYFREFAKVLSVKYFLKEEFAKLSAHETFCLRVGHTYDNASELYKKYELRKKIKAKTHVNAKGFHTPNTFQNQNSKK